MSLTSTLVVTRAPASQQTLRCAMVAKLVKWAATSAGVLSQGKGEVESPTQKETEWLRAHLDVGKAVRRADAKGPCWEGRRAQGSPNSSHTSSLMYCCCNCWVAFCCHPNLGWLGSGSATRSGSSLHDGISRPAVTNDCSHARTASKHGAVPSYMWVIIISVMVGCRSFTIRTQSAQLAQWAPPLERCALANPNLPPTGTKWRSPSPDLELLVSPILCACKSTRCHRALRSGQTALSQKFALVDAHMSNSHAA